jgi:hypothetical protein
MPGKPGNPRNVRSDHRGYDRDPTTAVNDARATNLRAQGLNYQQIADRLNLGSRGKAHDAVQRCLRDTLTPPADELRILEAERLDDLTRKAYEVLAADHIVTQHGKIVRDEDGEPVKDHELTLKAIDRILRLSDARRRLLGLDVPVRADVTVHQVDVTELALMEIIREAQAKNAQTEAAIKGEIIRDEIEGG